MVGSNRVVENVEPIALLRLEQPLQPALTVSRELEKKRLLMATVRNVPDLPWDVMTVGACHVVFP